jgi:hypothetical protein
LINHTCKSRKSRLHVTRECMFCHVHYSYANVAQHVRVCKEKEKINQWR